MAIQPEQFSQIIGKIFAEEGISTPWRETILLKDRHYVGRKFQADDLQVIWWLERNRLEVFKNGKMEQRIDLTDSLAKAA